MYWSYRMVDAIIFTTNISEICNKLNLLAEFNREFVPIFSDGSVNFLASLNASTFFELGRLIY